MILSFKVFRKLHYQLKNYKTKLNEICAAPNNSLLSVSVDKAVLNKLAYLQNKSLELSYAQSSSDCLKLINSVARELFSYDKVTVL